MYIRGLAASWPVHEHSNYVHAGEPENDSVPVGAVILDGDLREAVKVSRPQYPSSMIASSRLVRRPCPQLQIESC